jgi:tetratricopeptide (TPR) repeat protein
MTALAPSRPSPLRATGILVAAVVIVVASNATSLLLGGKPATADRSDSQGAALIEAAGAGPDNGVGSLFQIDSSIAAWTANLAANDQDFISATNLGLLYDARGRLTGDIADYGRAQAALDKALAVLPTHLPARLLHARLLQTTHDFAGALAESRAILADDSTQAGAVATMGDALLELGDVDGAAGAFARLATEVPAPAVTARLSRLAFIRGDPTAAGALASKAFDDSLAEGDTGAQLGWYAYLAGTVAQAAGDAPGALRWFDRAVSTWPDSYLALAGMARAEAALGRTDDAIASFKHAIAVSPQPDALTALGDLYALRGDSKLAEQQYSTVEAIAQLAALNRQVYNRQLVLFSVNHDRNLADALRLADQELAIRKDVYGYDAEAWALLANGRAADADVAMEHALALGTRDAMLDYHAGMIAAALGDTTRARTSLSAALAIKGALDPLAASRAEAALGKLR